MTKAQRLQAMGRVINACNSIKDKKPLAEAVRKIVDELHAQEKAHREAAAAEQEANQGKGKARSKERRFAPEVGNAIKALPDEHFRYIETVIQGHLEILKEMR